MKPHVLGRLPVVGIAMCLLSLLHAQNNYPIGTYTNNAFRYRVAYPTNWRAMNTPEMFCIENFPVSAAVRGSHLPLHGAGIKILHRSQVVASGTRFSATLAEWSQLGLANREIIGRREFKLRDNFRVIEVTSRCCEWTPEETVSWYFESGGEYFVASLYYWVGNPKIESLMKVMRQVVLSFERTSEPDSEASKKRKAADRR